MIASSTLGELKLAGNSWFIGGIGQEGHSGLRYAFVTDRPGTGEKMNQMAPSREANKVPYLETVLEQIPRGSARYQLFSKIAMDDPYASPAEELAAVRLEAARETFALRRQQIEVLDRRANDMGVSEVRTFADLVPLMFSHTTYKSYPNSFITQGRWDRLLKWFGTLSASPVNNVDVSGVNDMDAFIDRLRAGGHLAVTTSGTSGKVSFVHRVKADENLWLAWIANHYQWPGKVLPVQNRHYFQFGARTGPFMMMAAGALLRTLFARPDSRYYLSEGPYKVSILMRAAEMRSRIASSTATPLEIAEFEAQAKAQSEKGSAQLDLMCDKIIELRREPMIILSNWAPMWHMVGRARARGIDDGEFHPDTIVHLGGGRKGASLPDDYEGSVRAFFGRVNMASGYNMSEQSVMNHRCEAGRYHIVPWIIPLILDRTGEQLLDHGNGVIEGRYSLLDVGLNARWGGLITGDKVKMDFGAHCPCGRSGPSIIQISRYSDLGEEDKIGCAGTIEAYIRGALSE
jgi:hypothetical protein